MTTRIRLGALSAAALAALVALPALTFANTNPQIAATGGMTATLPLFGSPLTVEVTLDPVGNISSVGLDPVGDFSATSLDAHAVTFENSGDTAQVRIRAKGDRLSISARAGALADLLGSGTWTADVFGTGESSSVDYTIGDAGDGTPTITIDAVNVPAGVVTATHPTTTSSEDGEASAKARVDFSLNGFQKNLTIKVTVEDEEDDDGGTHATLKITLTGKDRQRLEGTLAELAGPHAWNGTLCDGTAVSATFIVGLDGSISFGGATGAPAEDMTLGDWDGHEGDGDGAAGVFVRFTDTKVSVKAMLLPREGDTFVLSIKGKSGNCGKHEDQDPEVNTPINEKKEKGDHDGDRQRDGDRHGDNGDHDDGDHDGGDDHDDEDHD